MNIRQISVLMARIALFVIYFWFGLLKVIGLSPASPMVTALFKVTMSPMLEMIHMPYNMSPSLFVIAFGVFETLLGVLFLIPRFEKAAIALFFVHMTTTALPLFVLGSEVWTRPFVPTLEGQYILKNLALIACVLSVWSILPQKQTS